MVIIHLYVVLPMHEEIYIMRTYSHRKYFNTVKYTCANCTIIRLNIELYEYRKYVLLALV